MHAERAPVAVSENLKIAASLRGFDNAEGVLLLRDWQIVRLVAGDLEENTRVRASFIGLPGAVQKARAEAEHGRDLLALQNFAADLFERFFVLGKHGDVGEQ